MSETLKELENRILVLRSATNAKGARLTEYDPKYAREVFALQVQLAERTKVEAPQGPKIHPDQLHGINRVEMMRDNQDLQLNQRASAAIDPASIPRNDKGEAIGPGKRYVETQPAVRAKLHAASTQVFDGRPLSEGARTATLKAIEGTK
jgi:hypothetical protein